MKIFALRLDKVHKGVYGSQTMALYDLGFQVGTYIKHTTTDKLVPCAAFEATFHECRAHALEMKRLLALKYPALQYKVISFETPSED